MSLAAIGLAGARPTTAQEAISTESEVEQAADVAIERMLERRVSKEFHDVPLSEILAALSQATDVPLQLDEDALEDNSIDAHDPLDCELKSISLRAALTQLLEPLELVWIIQDEVLLVTTPEKACGHLVVKVYPVAELIGQRSADGLSYRSLIETIADSVSPESWDQVGGPGTIHEFHAAGALVIGQTRAIHGDIAQLLADLRRTGAARVLRPRSPPDPPAASSRQPGAGADSAPGGQGFF